MATSTHYNPIEKADILHGTDSIGLKSNKPVYDNYAVQSSSDYYIGGEIAALLENASFRADVRAKLGDDIQAVDIQVTDHLDVFVRKPGETDYKLVNLRDKPAVNDDLIAIAKKTQKAFEAFQKDKLASSPSTPGSTASSPARPMTERTVQVIDRSELQERIQTLESRLDNFELRDLLSKQNNYIAEAEKALGTNAPLASGIQELKDKLAKLQSEIEGLNSSNAELKEKLIKANAKAFITILRYEPLLREIGKDTPYEALQAIRELKASTASKEKLLGEIQGLVGADSHEGIPGKIQALKEAKEALEKELDQLRQDNQLQLEKMQDLVQEIPEDFTQEDPTEQIQALAKAYQDLKVENPKLKQQIKELEDANASLQAEVTTNKATIARVEAEKDGDIQALKTSVKGKDGRINRLKEDLEKTHLEADGLRGKLKEVDEAHRSEIGKLNGEIDSLTDAKGELEGQVRKLEQDAKRTQTAHTQEIEGLKKQIASKEATISQKQEEIERLSQLNATLTQTHGEAESTLQEQLRSAKSTIAKLGELNGSQGEEIEGLKSQLADAKSEVASQASTIEQLKGSITKLEHDSKENIQEIKGQLDEATSELESLRSTSGSQEEQITQQTATIEGLEEKLAKAEVAQSSELEKLHAELSNATDQKKKASQEANQLQEKLIAATEENSTLTKENSSLSSQLQEAKSKIEQLESTLESQSSLSKEEATQLQSQLDIERGEVVRLTSVTENQKRLFDSEVESRKAKEDENVLLKAQLDRAHEAEETVSAVKEALGLGEDSDQEAILVAIEALDELNEMVAQYEETLQKVQEIAKSKGTVSSLATLIPELSESSNAYDGLPDDLTARFEDFEEELQQLGELQKANASLLERINELKTNLLAAEAGTKKALEANKELEEAKADGEAANKALQEKNKKLTEELIKLKSELKRAQRTIESQKETHKHLIEEINKAESKNEALEKKNSEYLEYFNLAQAKIKGLEQKVETQEDRIQELNKELEGVRKQLSQKGQEIKELEGAVAEVTQEAIGKQDLEKREKDLTKQLKKANAGLRETGTELAELKKKSAAQQRALEGIQAVYGEQIEINAVENPEDFMFALQALQSKQVEQINDQEKSIEQMAAEATKTAEAVNAKDEKIAKLEQRIKELEEEIARLRALLGEHKKGNEELQKQLHAKEAELALLREPKRKEKVKIPKASAEQVQQAPVKMAQLFQNVKLTVRQKEFIKVIRSSRPKQANQQTKQVQQTFDRSPAMLTDFKDFAPLIDIIDVFASLDYSALSSESTGPEKLVAIQQIVNGIEQTLDEKACNRYRSSFYADLKELQKFFQDKGNFQTAQSQPNRRSGAPSQTLEKFKEYKAKVDALVLCLNTMLETA